MQRLFCILNINEHDGFAMKASGIFHLIKDQFAFIYIYMNIVIQSAANTKILS